MSRLTDLLWRQRSSDLPVLTPTPRVLCLNSMPAMIFAEYASRAQLLTPEEKAVWDAFITMVQSARARLGGGIHKNILEYYL